MSEAYSSRLRRPSWSCSSRSIAGCPIPISQEGMTHNAWGKPSPSKMAAVFCQVVAAPGLYTACFHLVAEIGASEKVRYGIPFSIHLGNSTQGLTMQWSRILEMKLKETDPMFQRIEKISLWKTAMASAVMSVQRGCSFMKSDMKCLRAFTL